MSAPPHLTFLTYLTHAEGDAASWNPAKTELNAELAKALTLADA